MPSDDLPLVAGGFFRVMHVSEMPEIYDDYNDPRDWDEEDRDYEDCGLMPDGQCLKAGSEECDWECPMRMSEHFAGSPAWCKKHGVGP